jgi:hypothetical protein
MGPAPAGLFRYRLSYGRIGTVFALHPHERGIGPSDRLRAILPVAVALEARRAGGFSAGR